MNKVEIEKQITWDEYGIGYIELEVPLFAKRVAFEIFSGDDGSPGLSAKMYETILDVLNLSASSLERIKTLLWEECNFSFTVSDYGCEMKERETMKDAHFRVFDLKNLEDSYTKCHISSVQIHYESDQLNGRYAEIKIETATDNLISVIIKNGKVIDYDDDGTFLGWFEADEEKAHKQRMKVLGE